MNKLYIFAFALVGCCAALCAATVHDPQADYLVKYRAGDSVKKLLIDINGDGKTDVLFTYIEANPDPAMEIAEYRAGNPLSWDVYVADASSGFVVSAGVDEKGDNHVTQGAGPTINPDKMYVGNISEIGRYGIVTLETRWARAENYRTVYAYTWETDHLKEWKLAEYLESEQNAIFDKYLKEDKRTHVTLQQIKP